MALARVQATAKTKVSSSSTAAIPFVTPPTVGNGLVVFVNFWRPSPFTAIPTTCTDNHGNGYALAITRSSGVAVTGVFYCAAVATTGTPFTITASCAPAASAFWVGQAVEVSGVGTGLVVDQLIGATATTASAITTGSTPALTAAEVFQAAVCAISAAQGSITVSAATPTWTQEFEELPFTHIAGEADTRLVTSAAGTTPTVTWTGTTLATLAAALVAFAAGGAAPVAHADPYVWGPL